MANYYLKCEHCSHLNEMKTSYLVFCTNCGKKMNNSYPNWKLQNSVKQFEDFQREVCISGDQLNKVESKKPKQRKKLSPKTWVGIFAGIFIVCFVGFGTSYVLQEFIFPDLEKYQNSEWTTQTCGTLGLQIESPIEMKSVSKLEDEIPAETMAYIEGMETYESSVMNRKLYIMTNSIRYTPEINASLEGALKGTVTEMEKRPEVSDFKYDFSPVRKGDLQGVLITGKYKENDELYGYRVVIYTKGNVMWQVIVGYDYKDKFGYEISERIINSVSITPNIAENQSSKRSMATKNAV